VLPTATEVTLVAADPPRAGQLAFWGEGIEDADGALGRVELVLPAGTQFRRRQVEAVLVPIADMIGELVDLPATGADPSPSLRVWAAATRLALDLISRGRLLASMTAEGWDCWRVGPIDAGHRRYLDQLAAALPPTAHAVPVPETAPLQIVTAQEALRSFCDAVGDSFVRTSAAAASSSSSAFAGTEACDVTPAASWLVAVGPRGRDEPSVALRLEPPLSPDEPFCGVVQVHSATDPGLVVDAEALWAAGGAVLARFGDRAEEAVLLALRRGARVFPPLGRLLTEARPCRLVLDDDEAEALLGPTATELGPAGVEVLWPAELTGGLETRAVVGTESPEAVTAGAFSLSDLLDVRYEALLDGHPLTADELEQLAEAKRPMIRLRGRYVVVNPALVARLRSRQSMPAAEALGLALAGEAMVADEHGRTEVRVVGAVADLVQRLRDLELNRELDEPPGLDAELRHYQRRGLAWLSEMAELGLGGCLADDMGLGKTIQVIATHLHLGERRGPRPTLVVCPTSLLGNWRREIDRFAPSASQRRYHGRERTLDDLAGDEIVVTTYGVVRRDHALLGEVGWGLVVADEAQHVKNPLTRSARSLGAIPAAARFAMTGTPVENRLSDLWSLLNWSTPGLLPPLDRFRRTVAIPIERDHDTETTERFARQIKPFLLRRRKTDPGIAPELPPKTETDVAVLLSAEQATLYKAVLDDALEQIEGTEGIARQGLVFKLLTGLKQICNHPAHYLGQRGPLSGRSGKLDAAEELLATIVDSGEAALVFSQYVAMGNLLEQRFEDLGLTSRFLHGSMSITQRDELVDAFQAGRFDVFVLSLKAAGTGLNLTRASQVIHYDRWWNPAVEDQASDRAWRIGQDRAVQVHRLVTEGTLEERIAATLAGKRQLAESVVGSGEAWIAELSDDELHDLLALGSTAGVGAGAGKEGS
jgi:superfamily II DNA or RNA helicase